MAEKKNFTIENYNGTDYDTLYPETNSGQVLLDTTAQAATNLPTGKTLDDALQHITKDGGGFQVGDTLTTARTNLGDKWLLCNGDILDSSKYPDLYNTLQPASIFDSKYWSSNRYSSNTLVNQNVQVPLKIVQADDTYYMITSYPGDKSKQYDTLYTKTPQDSASWVKMPKYNNNNPISDMVYFNGEIYVMVYTPYAHQLLKYNQTTQQYTSIMDREKYFVFTANNSLYIADTASCSKVNDDGTTTYIVGKQSDSNIFDNGFYSVGNKVYCKKCVIDVVNKTLSYLTFNTTVPSNTDRVHYYYKYGVYYAHSFTGGVLYQSFDGVTFNVVDSNTNNMEMVVIEDNILLGQKTFSLSASGATLTQNNGSEYSCNVFNTQELNFPTGKISLIHVTIQSSSTPYFTANTNVFDTTQKRLPTVSPSLGLYTYIKAKN